MIKKNFLKCMIVCLLFTNVRPVQAGDGIGVMLLALGMVVVAIPSVITGFIWGLRDGIKPNSDGQVVENADNSLIKCFKYREQVNILKSNKRSKNQDKLNALFISLNRNDAISKMQFKNYLCELKGLIFSLKNNRKILLNRKNRPEIKSWLMTNEEDLKSYLSSLKELYNFLNFNKTKILTKITV
jgi:hypothetical protein